MNEEIKTSLEKIKIIQVHNIDDYQKKPIQVYKYVCSYTYFYSRIPKVVSCMSNNQPKGCTTQKKKRM